MTLGAVGLETTSFNVENLGFAEDKPGRKILYFDLSTEWEHPSAVDEADGTSKAAKIVKKLGEEIGFKVDCTKNGSVFDYDNRFLENCLVRRKKRHYNIRQCWRPFSKQGERR